MTVTLERPVEPLWVELAALTAAAEPAMGDGPKFKAVLAAEGVMTSDNRILSVDGASWRNPPITLMLMLEGSHGGQAGGSIPAGRIEKITVDGRRVLAEGTIDLKSPGGEMAAEMVGNKTLRFVSIDIGQHKVDVMVNSDGAQVQAFDEYEIMGATIVPFPAFGGEAVIWLDGSDAPTEATMLLPDPPTLEKAPDDGLLDQLLHAASDPSAMVAAAVPAHPPASWFARPDGEFHGMVNITDDGRVYGRLYTWGQCHVGNPYRCVTIPPSKIDYGMYRLGDLVTAEGSHVATGPLVLKDDHCPIDGYNAAEANRYYADTGLAFADVAMGEDDQGIWYSGALRPGVSDVEIRRARGSALSGDWRRVGSQLELVGVMAVNTPGYPQLRARVASGVPLAVVASAGPPPEPGCGCGGMSHMAAPPPPHKYVPSAGKGSPCKVCGGLPDSSAHTMSQVLDELRSLRAIVSAALTPQAIAALEADIGGTK